jgi:hypothetical protein
VFGVHLNADFVVWIKANRELSKLRAFSVISSCRQTPNAKR